ncbi:MAG TPA: type II secretion system protein [Candidatus Paceibacterota bacterium]
MKSNASRGFTLIELLVVIAVIGILASVVMTSLNSARGKARDAQRAATIREIQKGLEFYYDKYGYYPHETENECVGTEGYTTVNNNFMQSLVTEGFLPAYPKDPNNVNCNVQYGVYNANNQSYIVFVKFEKLPPNGRCNQEHTDVGYSCFMEGEWPS